MRKICVLLVGMILLGVSCKKEDPAPQFSGLIEFSSERLGSGNDYVFYGFSFEIGQVTTYSLTGSARPDLSVNHLSITSGTIESVYLEGSDDQEAFHREGNFATAEEAEVFYNNYNEVSTTDFVPLAHNIKVNQVWTVQTAQNKFAKIWIKEVTENTGSQSEFASVKILYEYQPDGSKTFDCGCN